MNDFIMNKLIRYIIIFLLVFYFIYREKKTGNFLVRSSYSRLKTKKEKIKYFLINFLIIISFVFVLLVVWDDISVLFKWGR